MANSRFDQLMQIFKGCIWDGDLISKSDRDSLVNLGLVEKCTGGWNIITAKGITYLVELGFVRSGLTKRALDAAEVCPNCNTKWQFHDPRVCSIEPPRQ